MDEWLYHGTSLSAQKIWGNHVSNQRDTNPWYENWTIRTPAFGYTKRTRRHGPVQILPFITQKFHKYSLGRIHLSSWLHSFRVRRCLRVAESSLHISWYQLKCVIIVFKRKGNPGSLACKKEHMFIMSIPLKISKMPILFQFCFPIGKKKTRLIFLMVPCNHVMARRLVSDKRHGFQVWRIPADMLNTQW